MKVRITLELTSHQAAELVKPTRPYRKLFKKAIITLQKLHRLARERHIYAYLSMLTIKKELNQFTEVTTQATQLWIKKIRPRDRELAKANGALPIFKAQYVVMNSLHYELLQALKQLDMVFSYHDKALWMELLKSEKEYYRAVAHNKHAWFSLLTRINAQKPNDLPVLTLQNYLDGVDKPEINSELLYQAFVAPFTPRLTRRELDLLMLKLKVQINNQTPDLHDNNTS